MTMLDDDELTAIEQRLTNPDTPTDGVQSFDDALRLLAEVRRLQVALAEAEKSRDEYQQRWESELYNRWDH